MHQWQTNGEKAMADTVGDGVKVEGSRGEDGIATQVRIDFSSSLMVFPSHSYPSTSLSYCQGWRRRLCRAAIGDSCGQQREPAGTRR